MGSDILYWIRLLLDYGHSTYDLDAVRYTLMGRPLDGRPLRRTSRERNDRARETRTGETQKRMTARTQRYQIHEVRYDNNWKETTVIRQKGSMKSQMQDLLHGLASRRDDKSIRMFIYDAETGEKSDERTF